MSGRVSGLTGAPSASLSENGWLLTAEHPPGGGSQVRRSRRERMAWRCAGGVSGERRAQKRDLARDVRLPYGNGCDAADNDVCRLLGENGCRRCRFQLGPRLLT